MDRQLAAITKATYHANGRSMRVIDRSKTEERVAWLANGLGLKRTHTRNLREKFQRARRNVEKNQGQLGLEYMRNLGEINIKNAKGTN